MPLSQRLEVGELVVGREERVGLAVALDLRRFVEPLPLRPHRGVFAIDGLAGERLDQREHAPVAQVAVVRDGEHVAAGLVLVRLHPPPEVAGVVAALGRIDGERLDLAGPPAIVPEEHVAVQIVAARVRRPLVPDEGREATRLVRVVGRRDGVLPGRAEGGHSGRVHQRRRELALREGDDDLDGRIGALARLHHVVPATAGRIGQHRRLPREQIGKEPHVVGVVRHHQEVERARQSDPLPARGGDLLSLGESVRVGRAEAAAERAGVHRHPRVQMRVAEKGPGRKRTAGIGRIARAPCQSTNGLRP